MYRPAVAYTVPGWNLANLRASLLDLTEDPGTIIFWIPNRETENEREKYNSKFVIQVSKNC